MKSCDRTEGNGAIVRWKDSMVSYGQEEGVKDTAKLSFMQMTCVLFPSPFEIPLRLYFEDLSLDSIACGNEKSETFSRSDN